MKAALWIAVAGALGALARWGLVRWGDAVRGDCPFPVGILAANLAGCFAFGCLFGFLETRPDVPETAKLAIFTGFLGSLTTFSTLGWNTVQLLRNGQPALAASNVILSVVVGLAAVWGGYELAR